ncbi:MAG TPA: hypothetical protein VL069_16200, partial [Opitutus sp.]|nr:hypothetical protein [Opitutus sp.]
MSLPPLMKPARVLVVTLGVLAVGLLIVGLLAFNSSVQTWAARRALAERPDLNATLGSISVGLQRVEIRALQAESNGAVLTLPSLDAVLPVIAAGLQNRVEIKSLVAKGWTLDLTRAEDLKTVALRSSRARENQASTRTPRGFSLVSTAHAAEAAKAAEPLFRGVFASLQLPVDLSLDGAELEGEVLLPDLDGSGIGRVQVKLTGGGLGSGLEGNFVLDAAGTKADGGSLTLQSTLNATMDTPRTFTRLSATANAAASGVQFPEGVTLKIDGTAVRTPAGETYGLLFAGNDKQLADIDAELVNATSQIAGTWKLDVRDVDLAPFVLGKQLPTFTATGQGGFQTGTTLKEIHASGHLAASADRLEALRPELAAVGAVNLTADFDVLQHKDSLRVERLDATFSGTEPVARIQALQPFEFNLGTGELHVADPAQDLVGLWLTGMPVAWARPFTGDLELTGGNLRGEFVASARDGGLALRSKTPLTALGLNLKNAEEPWLREIDLRLTASADYTPRGWQVQVEEITAQSQGRTLLKLNAKAGKLIGENEGIKATGSWSADLPGWARQPVMAGGMALSAGQAGGEFNGSFGEVNAVDAKIALSGLIMTTGEALPSINSDLRAEIDANARTKFNAATLFNLSGRQSDLSIVGTLSSAADVTTIDARVSSERVVLED